MLEGLRNKFKGTLTDKRWKNFGFNKTKIEMGSKLHDFIIILKNKFIMSKYDRNLICYLYKWVNKRKE